jgi:endonuclease/exonuclease/phosphatase family metal-dependent hydrolase
MYLENVPPVASIERPAVDVGVPGGSADLSLDPTHHTRDLSVLTYNVKGLPWPIASGRGDALREIGRELAQMRQSGLQPDVVLIQEGFRSEIADLVETSGYRFWARGPGRGSGFGRLTGAGLHVLSDAPIINVKRHAFGDCAGLDCFANKGAMWVRVVPEGAATPIDIVNTHLNSKRASRAAPADALAAHNRQVRQLNTFIDANREVGIPMVIGGDFNVKNAPQRYYYDALDRPYTVVSEFCSQQASDCGGAVGGDPTMEPWLRSQDLQAFVSSQDVDVRPLKTDTVFAGSKEQARLSDHDGYVVRYQLRWARPDSTFKYRASESLVVKPRMGAWGVKVSWKP